MQVLDPHIAVRRVANMGQQVARAQVGRGAVLHKPAMAE